MSNKRFWVHQPFIYCILGGIWTFMFGIGVAAILASGGGFLANLQRVIPVLPFIALGIFVIIVPIKWSIHITGEVITHTPIFGKKKVYSVKDILFVEAKHGTVYAAGRHVYRFAEPQIVGLKAYDSKHKKLFRVSTFFGGFDELVKYLQENVRDFKIYKVL